MPINAKFKPSKFRKGEDLIIWIKRFEKAAILSVWSDEAKLFVVDSCLPFSVQSWFTQSNFATWAEFRKEFELRYRVRRSPEKLLKKILSFEMKRNESIYKYIDRFNKLRSEYEIIVKLDKDRRIVVVAPTPVNTSGNNGGNAPTPAGSPSSSAPLDDSSLIDIHEANYVKYFIDGLRFRTMKRQLRGENHATLKGVQDSIKQICAEDDDYVDDSTDDDSSSSNDDDSDKESDDSDDDICYETRNKKKKEISKPKTQTTSSDPELKELVKNMSLMMGEFVKPNQNVGRTNQTSGNTNNFAFYNCHDTTHRVSDCPNSCKLCKNPDHRHYQCSLYVSKKKPVQSPVLITEVLVAKRTHETNEDAPNIPLVIADVLTRKRVKTVRQPEEPVRRQSTRTRNKVEEQGHGHTSEPILATYKNGTTTNNIDNTDVGNSGYQAQADTRLSNVSYPNLPTTEDRSNRDELSTEQSKLVQDIMDRPMLQHSLNQLVSLSPSSRTQFKAAFTKAQKRPHAKKNPHLLIEAE